MRPARTGPLAGALCAATVVVLGGCSSGGHPATPPPPPPVAFEDSAAGPDCMRHQHKAPVAADVSGGDVGRSLTVLRYYTAHGSQAFCDGATATSTDLQWIRLYVAQGADPGHVARWLPAR